MTISTAALGDITFNGDVHTELGKYQVPGGKMTTACGDFGKIMLHAIPPSLMRAVHSVYRVQKDTSFRITSEPSPKMHIALKNDRRLRLKGLEDIYLLQGQLNMMYSPEGQYTKFYKKGKDYISIDIDFPIDFLQQWVSFFPMLEKFLEKIETGKPAWLFEKHCQVTAGVMNMIHDITQCQYDQPYHKVFFDNQANTLLFLLLTQANEPGVTEENGSDEMYSIFNARTLITENPRYHYSIPEIAAEVGLNQFKLKRGFKEVFGTGLYEYLVEDRMAKAKLMLEDTAKPIKEIAVLVGYKNSSSFIKAFSKKFKQSPYAMRLMKRKSINSILLI